MQPSLRTIVPPRQLQVRVVRVGSSRTFSGPICLSPIACT